MTLNPDKALIQNLFQFFAKLVNKNMSFYQRRIMKLAEKWQKS